MYILSFEIRLHILVSHTRTHACTHTVIILSYDTSCKFSGCGRKHVLLYEHTTTRVHKRTYTPSPIAIYYYYATMRRLLVVEYSQLKKVFKIYILLTSRTYKLTRRRRRLLGFHSKRLYTHHNNIFCVCATMIRTNLRCCTRRIVIVCQPQISNFSRCLYQYILCILRDELLDKVLHNCEYIAQSRHCVQMPSTRMWLKQREARFDNGRTTINRPQL